MALAVNNNRKISVSFRPVAVVFLLIVVGLLALLFIYINSQNNKNENYNRQIKALENKNKKLEGEKTSLSAELNVFKKLTENYLSLESSDQTLIEKVGKLVEFPPNEEPSVATVKDVTKLQGQQFFQNAQNGDKVLIFHQAKRAILYRPSTNVVVEYAPVEIQ